MTKNQGQDLLKLLLVLILITIFLTVHITPLETSQDSVIFHFNKNHHKRDKKRSESNFNSKKKISKDNLRKFLENSFKIRGKTSEAKNQSHISIRKTKKNSILRE